MAEEISELMMAAIAAVIAATQGDGDDPAQIARQPGSAWSQDHRRQMTGKASLMTPEQGAPHGGNRMTDTRKVIVNGTEYEVELEGDGTTWKATVAGQSFDIEMPEAAVAAKPRRSGGRKKKKSGTVSANIPGKVVTVEVEEGQEVAEGQVILILEAMKMQNEIQAPVSGTVVSVHCSEGEAIEANVPLVVIEPVASEDED